MMKCGTMYKQGEIVLIPVPFTDLSTTKRRPVLVISNDKYNETTSDLIVVAITSNISQSAISLTNKDMKSGLLPLNSVIRCDKIYTLDQKIDIKSLGTVSQDILTSVNKGINKLIKPS